MGEKLLKSKTNKLDVTENNDINQTTEEMHREITFNKMKQTLENFESSIVSNVQQKMENMIQEILQSIKHYEINAIEFKDFAYQQHQLLWSNRKETDKNLVDDKKTKDVKINELKQKKLPDKIFKPRNSYLTCLLEINHMKSIYHIFFVILTVLFMHTIVHDFVTEGKINIGIETVTIAFGGLHKAFALWTVMQLSVLAVYYVFKLWAVVRFSLQKNKKVQRLWNFTCLLSFVSYQLYFSYIVSMYVVKLDLALVTSIIILIEMVRFMMKTHAFVRTNSAIQIAGKFKSHDEDDKENVKDSNGEMIKNSKLIPVPKISKYLYFLFAPTLVYRDEYPRTKVIRWNFVMSRVTEIVAIIFFQSYFCERFLRPTFQDFGKVSTTPGNILVAIFNMMMPGVMLHLSSFYVLLHAWLNTTGELLKFADRMFYKDWWTSRNYQSFYRNWNVVVHDWLYEYIYKDCYNYIFKGSKFLSTLTTFLISAIVHEYILAIALRYVFPVLFICFLSSVILTFIMQKFEHEIGNFIVWLSLGSGNGIIIAFYCMEYYARTNCSVDGLSWVEDYMMPRISSCNGITTNTTIIL